MKLKYTGFTVGRLRDGMLLSVPTDWDTSCWGNVEEAAWPEIAEALQRRGLYFSAKDNDYIFGTHRNTDPTFSRVSTFLTNWEKA